MAILKEYSGTKVSAGDVLTGMYMRSTYEEPVEGVVFEVTATVAIPDGRGRRSRYLFGTRRDTGAAGRVCLMLADCFNPMTLKVERAQDFRPVEDAAAYWSVSGSKAIGFCQKMRADLEPWAKSLNGVRIMDCQADAYINVPPAN